MINLITLMQTTGCWFLTRVADVDSWNFEHKTVGFGMGRMDKA